MRMRGMAIYLGGIVTGALLFGGTAALALGIQYHPPGYGMITVMCADEKGVGREKSKPEVIEIPVLLHSGIRLTGLTFRCP